MHRVAAAVKDACSAAACEVVVGRVAAAVKDACGPQLWRLCARRVAAAVVQLSDASQAQVTKGSEVFDHN